MKLSFGTSAAREREKELGTILARIERLESTPSPTPILSTLSTIEDDIERLRGQLSTLVSTVDELANDSKDFTIALADGIEHVDRAERRVKSTVARARQKFAAGGYSDPDLEAEASDLHKRDGEGSGGEQVYPVPALVEPAEAASSIRGVSATELRKVRNIG